MRRIRWFSKGSVAGAVLLALSFVSAPSEASSKSAAMVIDANTGRVLHDNAGTEPRYPASLTKMMTLYLAFETIEAGRLSFSSPIPISEHAAQAAPSKLGLKAGSSILLRDAIKALIVKSANDVAVAIAEKIGGSEEGFARLMTKRARQLGMNDTTFRNASGLPDSEQVTTARDMLTLALRLQDDFPRHYSLFATRSFSHGGKTYRTHNALIGRFPGVDGIKTGYTRASGFNLVSSYRAGSKHVVAAVFGGTSARLRDAHMRVLLARAIEKASTSRTRKVGPELVAEAKPAKRPTANQAAMQVATPAPPTAAPVVTSPPAPDATTVSAESDAPPAPAPQARIAIAKVKTVPVLARATGAVPSMPDRAEPLGSVTPVPTDPIAQAIAESSVAPPTAAAPAALTFAGTMPRPDFIALKAELAARAGDEAGPFEADPFEVRQPPLAPAAPAPAAEWLPGPSETVLPKQTALGRPPGTLQAQLARLTGTPDLPDRTAGTAVHADLPPVPVPVPVSTGVAAVPAHVAAPAPARATTAGGFHVQIGVYRSTEEAERAMAAARVKAAHVLAERAPLAMPLTKGDKQLYRARFAGFDAATATSACNELRRRGFDCFVARPN